MEAPTGKNIAWVVSILWTVEKKLKKRKKKKEKKIWKYDQQQLFLGDYAQGGTQL